MGCTLRARVEGGEVIEVSGQSCKRGLAFAREEILAPHRTLTTTVQVRGGVLPLLPVRSRAPLPQALLLPAADVLRHIVLQAPVQMHQVIVPDILGSGIDIIAGRKIKRCSP